MSVGCIAADTLQFVHNFAMFLLPFCRKIKSGEKLKLIEGVVMVKKTWIAVSLGIMILLGGLTASVGAAPAGYGATGAATLAEAELTLPVMLTFALQDEYLARGEYQVIIQKFGASRPFSNIIKAEEQHIAWLVPLLEKYGVPLPADRGVELAIAPDTLANALQAGVTAEISNIEMYEKFLRRDLPADVKAVFEHLLAASKNHLAAFQGGRGGPR